MSKRTHMPIDLSGNVETCGDGCISVRFAKDTGRDVALPTAVPTLCGFCGGYVTGHHGVCTTCIKERGLEGCFVDEDGDGRAGAAGQARPAAG